MDNTLIEKYEQAMRKVRECRAADVTSEAEAGKAYQALVKEGLAMQIRKKYRGR